MASVTLLDCDEGRAKIVLDLEDLTGTVLVLRGTNRSKGSATLILNSAAGDKETMLTMPPGTLLEQALTLPVLSRFSASRKLNDVRGDRGIWDGLHAIALWPSS